MGKPCQRRQTGLCKAMLCGGRNRVQKYPLFAHLCAALRGGRQSAASAAAFLFLSKGLFHGDWSGAVHIISMAMIMIAILKMSIISGQSVNILAVKSGCVST